MEMMKYKFVDLLDKEKGIIRGPFGGDVKKDFFIPKSEEAFKIYEQGVVYNKDPNIGNYYISKERYEKLKRFAVQPGDILISGAGTLGELFELPNGIEKGIINQALIRIRVNESFIDKKYFKFYFSWYIKEVACKHVGASVIPNLPPLEDLKKIDVNIPSISNQKKIASVLSALDDKIALNKKINQKLEAMAKRLYDYWFVQYDFPDKNGHPYKTTGGPMTYNPTLKREIPAGWEVVDINELCQIVDCLHSKKPDFCYESENSYLLALENITKEGYIDLSDKYYISKKDFAEWTSRICVRENDFLFTNAGRAGDMGMVPEGVLCAIGRNITAVRPEKINPWYLRCFFKSLYMQEQILNNLDQGSFFMSFNVRSIKKLQVLMPSEPLMKKFISFVEPHLKRIEKNNKEISRLTKLRDKLLPLLMNGQVVVG